MHSYENLRKAVKESGKDRDLFQFKFKYFPPPQNGGCGAPTHVAGTNGGTMPCGAFLTMLGERKPYYCGACQEEHNE